MGSERMGCQTLFELQVDTFPLGGLAAFLGAGAQNFAIQRHALACISNALIECRDEDACDLLPFVQLLSVALLTERLAGGDRYVQDFAPSSIAVLVTTPAPNTVLGTKTADHPASSLQEKTHSEVQLRLLTAPNSECSEAGPFVAAFYAAISGTSSDTTPTTPVYPPISLPLTAARSLPAPAPTTTAIKTASRPSPLRFYHCCVPHMRHDESHTRHGPNSRLRRCHLCRNRRCALWRTTGDGGRRPIGGEGKDVFRDLFRGLDQARLRPEHRLPCLGRPPALDPTVRIS